MVRFESWTFLASLTLSTGSLAQGDEDCIGPNGKLLCLWQTKKVMQYVHSTLHTRLTVGPIQLFVHLFLLKSSTSYPYMKLYSDRGKKHREGSSRNFNGKNLTKVHIISMKVHIGTYKLNIGTYNFNESTLYGHELAFAQCDKFRLIFKVK